MFTLELDLKIELHFIITTLNYYKSTHTQKRNYIFLNIFMYFSSILKKNKNIVHGFIRQIQKTSFYEFLVHPVYDT